MTDRPRAPLALLIREAKRELHKRQEVYPRLVMHSQLTQARADQLLRWQEDIITVLEELERRQQLDLFPSNAGAQVP